MLGLTIDRQLNFTAHIDRVCQKAIRIYKAVSTAARATWGLKPDILRMLYAAIVEPVVLYAASAWAERTKRAYVRKKLDNST